MNYSPSAIKGIQKKIEQILRMNHGGIKVTDLIPVMIQKGILLGRREEQHENLLKLIEGMDNVGLLEYIAPFNHLHNSHVTKYFVYNKP